MYKFMPADIFRVKTSLSRSQKLKPKPRYGQPGTGSSNGQQDFHSTLDIRDNVYQQWCAERDVQIRKEKLEKIKKEMEEEEKKKKVIYNVCSFLFILSSDTTQHIPVFTEIHLGLTLTIKF